MHAKGHKQNADLSINRSLSAASLNPSIASIPLVYPQQNSSASSVQTGSNPLVAAASSILVIASRLKQEHSFDLNILYTQLAQEIILFDQRVQRLNYHAETNLLARYILCATLDEILEAFPLAASAPALSLLNSFHHENWAGERFFLLLERLRLEPNTYIDLLELIYFCLDLGFTGKYRNLSNGDVQLAEISEQLYQQIRRHRGPLIKNLLLGAEIGAKPSRKVYPLSSSRKLFILALMILSVGLFLSLHYFVQKTWLPAYDNLINTLTEL